MTLKKSPSAIKSKPDFKNGMLFCNRNAKIAQNYPSLYHPRIELRYG